MRILVATFVVAGCSFEHGGADPAGDPTVDGGGTTQRFCKYPDASLRLCVEFDDRAYSPFVHDSSPYHLDAPASDLNELVRSNSPAAGFFLSSDLRVPESPHLDITEQLTLEMWVASGYYQPALLLANDRQYGLGMDAAGHAICGIAGLTATSTETIQERSWTHVACVYDGELLRVFVNGAGSVCRDADELAIPTDGTAGTLIAPNYVGAIDAVRVYARALSATEICSHADRTGCTSTCW